MAAIQWNTARTKNILVIKMRHIGDTVLVPPLLHTLKQAMPRTRIHLLVNRHTAAIIKDHPHIHSLIIFDYNRAKRDLRYFFKFLLNIRRLGCDMVMDLTRNDRSALFTFVSGHGGKHPGHRTVRPHPLGGLAAQARSRQDSRHQLSLSSLRPLQTRLPLRRWLLHV